MDCKVIGLVLFPEKDAFRSEGKELKIDDEEFAEFRNYVESAIGRNIKIYRLQCSWEIDDLYENVLDYKSMSEAYESLRSVEAGSRSKYTKEGYVSIICNFLDRQGLIIFIPEDEMIKTTAKLDNIMEYKILNKENYARIMEALGAVHE